MKAMASGPPNRKFLRLHEVIELVQNSDTDTSENDLSEDIDDDTDSITDEQELIPIIGGGHDRCGVGRSPVHSDVELQPSDRDESDGEEPDPGGDGTVGPLPAALQESSNRTDSDQGKTSHIKNSTYALLCRSLQAILDSIKTMLVSKS